MNKVISRVGKSSKQAATWCLSITARIGTSVPTWVVLLIVACVSLTVIMELSERTGKTKGKVEGMASVYSEAVDHGCGA